MELWLCLERKKASYLKKSVDPAVKWAPFMIRHEALTAKRLQSDIYYNIFTNVLKIIKSCLVQNLCFATLYEEMGSKHNHLLFHSKVKWLSHGKNSTCI